MDAKNNLGFNGVDHVTFWVGNAKQAASYYNCRFGFQNLAFSGLTTGNRKYATHVVRLKQVTLCFTSPTTIDDEDHAEHMKLHGDAIKDIAFKVDDSRLIYQNAIINGAKSVLEPTELTDKDGTVIMSTIATPISNITYTFVERKNYTGEFLPGYSYDVIHDVLSDFVEPIQIADIDHVVYGVYENKVEETSEWFYKTLGFHRYWSVDDTIVHTENSGLNSIVVADENNSVKFPVIEPVNSVKAKSQTQEFVDFNGGPGCQHFAINTINIIQTVETLKKRGVVFIPTPKHYYSFLKKRLENCPVVVKEEIETLEKYGIFLDYDDEGYLLQTFTKNVQDKPTFIIEFIQKVGHMFGFGYGNFKSIFAAIELEQTLRGNLDRN
ncbi:4-hydroxyphenylpyruvate dioxygenase [Tieghemostelium lacteum]|uniref:4-hydroxyphenylpyruvate dioxygenase n=1 Tax=Tieghemostelium lacteum TaxID=361077 RepID=A0A151ZF29_TIELA|nr:4-hydroxyphenylpyruvate dioxygenase [Tieghemostelium lacteum]|eukprot:KYQ92571.1 4-hydroxyphenylpyruvate dioxygenase [Tieghemostelium lacteum]